MKIKKKEGALLRRARLPYEGKHKKGNTNITEDHIELALAWALGEINYAQVLQGLTGSRRGSMQAYVVLARALREGFNRGLIVPSVPSK